MSGLTQIRAHTQDLAVRQQCQHTKKKQYFEKTPLNLETIETINLDCVSKRGTFTASSTQIQGCVSIKERRKTLQEIDAIIAKSLDLLRLLCYTDSLCVLCCE